MKSLCAILFRSLHQRRPFGLDRLVTAEVTRTVGLSATIPLAFGHWQYVGNTAQGHRLNSTKANQPNDKKKPTGKGNKPKLTREEKKERKEKREKVVREFNEFIGRRKLEDWKKLCETIGLDGEFNSINSCREAIEAVHVNIYDVLDADATNQAGGKARPQRFQTPYELSEYSKRMDKIYPREDIIRSEPEGALLKHIANPRLDEEWQREKEEKMRRKKEMLKRERGN
ncbi:uncharacterized protein B0T23DRAFT_438728 [Neurospora hispaniola]|uniref:Uncharacterized protein n=1 Tax=Neurospora hispaniola TaxID=588809 RepID=A0AAJ0IDJ6_9PEZI|nr:hypothetical protein B0T23DRAFT_438728 [Neurospora hispaniola]